LNLGAALPSPEHDQRLERRLRRAASVANHHVPQGQTVQQH